MITIVGASEVHKKEYTKFTKKSIQSSQKSKYRPVQTLKLTV